MQKIAIIILAAGNSSRMGDIKQLLPYKNTSLIGWAIQNAKKSNAHSVFCVLGANAELIKKEINQYQIETILNTNYKEGLSSSITAGVNHIKDKHFDALLIMLADQPNVNTSYLNNLISKYQESSLKIIVSNYKEKVGVPAIFPKNYFNQLLSLEGDKGAKHLLQKQLLELVKLKPYNLIDIDTKEDYQNLIN